MQPTKICTYTRHQPPPPPSTHHPAPSTQHPHTLKCAWDLQIFAMSWKTHWKNCFLCTELVFVCVLVSGFSPATPLNCQMREMSTWHLVGIARRTIPGPGKLREGTQISGEDESALENLQVLLSTCSRSIGFHELLKITLHSMRARMQLFPGNRGECHSAREIQSPTYATHTGLGCGAESAFRAAQFTMHIWTRAHYTV